MKTIGQLIDQWISEMTPCQRERFEERAAIRQFCGGEEKEVAEELSAKEVMAWAEKNKEAK